MKLNFAAKGPAQIAAAIGAALVILVAVMGFAFKSDSTPDLASTPASRSDIENTVIATGTLEAAQLVSVGAQVSGQIKSVKVRLGDQVKAGKLIAEIDSTTQ